MKRIAFFALASTAIVLVFILVVLPRMRADAEAKLENMLIHEPYFKVKQGERRVNVMRRELIGLLASDPDCIENLLEINFSSVDLSDSDVESLSSLSHVSAINFYCCKNADSILPACRELPLTSVGFEATPFSPESVQLLGSIPTLANLFIEQNLDRKQIAAMKLLSKNIVVKSSFPMDAYD